MGLLGLTNHASLGGILNEVVLTLTGERRDEVVVLKVHACHSD